ncbi:hypothetical protein AVEN_16555-1 [Araneus ventricosus]|uniref:Uncharacterized protein n=1 Tax=Araneus ventricosus TaxID=182803 RepID=A0A4Y2KDF3_ARAVE|nr:hypothetical protein AVEN_16555-1 [Araneus ventricosus]
MLNRDSSVKSAWTHCSCVQLRCSRAQCNRTLTCTRDKGTQTTGRRANSPPSYSLRDTVWRDMGLPAAAEKPAVALLVSSCVWHIATGSDRPPLWRFSGVQTRVFYWRFDPFGNGSTAYGWHYDAHSAVWQQQIVLHQLATYRQPSNASHRAYGFFYSCFPLWPSRIARNYRCLRTEAQVRQATF